MIYDDLLDAKTAEMAAAVAHERGEVVGGRVPSIRKPVFALLARASERIATLHARCAELEARIAALEAKR